MLFVRDLNVALRFYVDKLGFEKTWHEGDGNGTVCQVHRGGCEIILCEDPRYTTRGRLYIELTADGFEAFSRELLERDVPTRSDWWGGVVMEITDPDGNELLFPETS